MRPNGIVIVAPEGDLAAGIVQCVGDLLVQQFIAQDTVEGIDKGVLLWFDGIDVVSGDVALPGPFQDRSAGR